MRSEAAVRRTFLHARLLFAALIGGACAAEPVEHEFVLRDSAGVLITESSAPLWSDDRIVIEAEPAVTIGAALDDESQQLYRVTDAMRLSDGRLLVLNSGTSEIRFYSETGDHLLTVGGAGEGPGEFSGPWWAHERSDTIAVFDPFQDNGRISYFALDGTFLGNERVLLEEFGIASPDAMLPDGWFLGEMSEGSIAPGEVGYVRYTRAVIRYPRDGSRVDTIAVAAGGETFREASRGGIAQWAIPFGSRPYTALGTDRVYVGNGQGFIIDVYALDGAHLQSIRVPEEPQPVTSGMVEQWVDASLAAPFYDGNAELRDRYRRRYSETPAASHVPAFDQLVADPFGNLWVRRYAPPWETRNSWRIFDPDGRWVGGAELPDGLEVFEIGSDYVLGRRIDELGVEYVQLHRVRRRVQ